MRHPQFAIRALLLGALIGGVFGGTLLHRATRPLAPPDDLATTQIPVVTPTLLIETDHPFCQIIFDGPEGANVIWDVTAPGRFDSEPLVMPGRYNFPSGAIYRLKLTNIPDRDGVVVYPTLELAPPLPLTKAYLDKNAIPVQFSEEDFDHVLTGNFVTKVIYLPDRDFQELDLEGVETLVSTRLGPGIDPIVEADRRGAILAIVRLGNVNLRNRQIWMPGPFVLE